MKVIAIWLRRATVALTALLPLVVLPGIERSFSTPKTLLLGGFVVIGGLCGLMSRGLSRPLLPIVCWLALTAFSSAVVTSAFLGEFVSQEVLWLLLSSVAWFLLVVALRPSALHLATAMVLASVVVAAVSILQYLGLDPFRVYGWSPPLYGSPRMRVFGTLGNPNFVAAFLVAGMPLTAAVGKILKLQKISSFAVAWEAVAILATGSRGALLGLAAALSWLGVLNRSLRWHLMTACALLIMVLPFFMESRPLKTTVAGRLYIWRVTASHLFERPLFGYGPGAFEPKYIQWETQYWRDGKGSADERKFAALQAHAHNDYLEILVNYGLAGLLGILSLMGSFFVSAFHRPIAPGGELIAGSSAGVAALCAVATVDFPLQRPAEMFVLWTLMGIVYVTLQTSTRCGDIAVSKNSRT